MGVTQNPCSQTDVFTRNVGGLSSRNLWFWYGFTSKNFPAPPKKENNINFLKIFNFPRENITFHGEFATYFIYASMYFICLTLSETARI